MLTRRIMKHKTWFALFLVIAILISACSPDTPGAVTEEAAEPVTLKIALIPVLDALPMYVAQAQGLFDKHQVQVEFIPVKSAPERDQLIASKQADGMVNEILSTMFFNKEQVQVQSVRFARAASSEAALFRIMAAPNSEITGVEGLKGVEIGISEGTVIQYLTERLLQAEGFSAEDIKEIAVPDITARMTLLNSGELKAAMLPEPLSTLAGAQGAAVALDDTSHPQYSFSTITFRKEVIDENPQAIRGFLAAIEEAVEIINTQPESLKPLLQEQNLVPAPILDSFVIYPFITAGVPSEAQWNDVLSWAQGKGLLEGDVAYETSVTDEYLP